MIEYCFFKKGNHITALDISDEEKSTRLIREGWKKQFEEIRADNAKNALNRLAEIRKEEITIDHAFVTGSVFSSLITAIFK